MGMVRLIGCLALLVLSWFATCSPSLAQSPCNENGDTDLEAVLSQHLERSAALMGMRGLPPPPQPEDIAAFASAITADLGSGTALLIFSAQEQDYCAVLLRPDAKPVSVHMADGVAHIDHALAEFAETHGITRTARSRAPQKRGVSIVEEAATPLPQGQPDALRHLSDTLLPEPIRRGLTGVRHLLIAPSGNLGTVPFSALTIDDSGAVLAERMSFAILPSLLEAAPGYVRISADYQIERPAETAPATEVIGPALVIGDPDGGGDPDWEFPPLPGARAEAEDIAALYGTQPLTGQQATLPVVLEGLQRRPRLIYLAAHGVADPDDPLRGSFIKLSDGRLTALAIQQMSLPAVPVFLSACQSGLGLAHDGGIIGLARAFDIAGAGPVTMSLWNIDDQATRTIMYAAVRNFGRQPLPEALRLAIMEYRAAHPGEPEKWAAFSVFGR